MAKHDKPHRAAKSLPADRRPWAERLRSPPLLCLLLALVTFAVYAPALRNDFVNYDDSDYVTANPHVQTGLKWENIQWAFTTGHASNWHPITWLSHMLDCQLFGQQPALHHLVSVLFHIANAVLLFLLLQRMTAAVWRSVVVAGLFSLHPLHVESVAWASERKDVLSALFFLLTLIAYTRYASRIQSSIRYPASSITRHPTRSTQHAHPAFYYILALFLFALGLMSKPMLVTVPFVLLLLDFWPLQRIRFFRASIQQSNNPSSAAPPLHHSFTPILPLIFEKLPFFALTLLSSAVTYFAQHSGGAVSGL